MELAIDMGLWAWGAVIIAAIAIGLLGQFIGRAGTGYEWLATAIGVALGAVAASEFVIAWRAIDPVWDNLALIPAVIGGLVVGVIVQVATRLLTGGTYATSSGGASV